MNAARAEQDRPRGDTGRSSGTSGPGGTGIDAIARAFARAAAERRAALIPFLAAGDPTADASVELAVAAATSGADILEIGLPFADSLADGPTIQAAYGRALRAGTGTDGVFACLDRIARRVATPIVLMTAFNPVRARGVTWFVEAAADAGVSGLLVPDLPLEHAGEVQAAASSAGLALIPLVAPDTTEARAQQIARAASGFVYLVRRRGVTGTARGASEVDDGRIGRLRDAGGLPVAVGFGIATAEDAADAGLHADAVVIGSALVDLAAGARRDPGAAVQALSIAVKEFARALRDARAITSGMEGSST